MVDFSIFMLKCKEIVHFRIKLPMLNFNEKDIKDIVSKLESGMIYYIHKTSGERIFVTKPFAIGKRFC